MISLDHRLERWVVGHRGEPFDSIFVALSRLGTWGLIWLAIALVGVFLWRRPWVFPVTLLALLVAELVADVLKVLVKRHRPVDHPLVHHLVTYSFPSGHTTTSFACAGTIARFAPRNVRPLLFVLAALIGFSRIYVGVHYPLDVLAGAVLGLLVATGLRMLPGALRRSPRSQPAG